MSRLNVFNVTTCYRGATFAFREKANPSSRQPEYWLSCFNDTIGEMTGRNMEMNI